VDAERRIAMVLSPILPLVRKIWSSDRCNALDVKAGM
jgi:hypothetical protein